MQQHPPATLTLRHTSWSRRLRVFGVLVACAGGFVVYGFIGGFVPYGSISQSVPLLLLTSVLAGIAGAILWRTWGAVVVVPAALWLGAVAAEVLYRVLSHAPFSVELALDLIVVAALPAMLGAAAGAASSMWLRQHLSK